ncbi:MAG TPA: MltA domain-containing protein, partial [Dongiaceae bacterium]|nr:MltA domain-containing protein [Dongiaceae bacterium]
MTVTLAACTQTEAPPPHLAELTALPGWQEDAGTGAAPALLASCGVIETLSSDQALGMGGPPTEWTRPCAAIRQAGDDAALKQALAAQFVALDPGAGTSALVTGYYEPELDGSRARDAAHPYPLYRLPPKPTQFDRSQIDAGALKGRKLELLWVSDRIDAFFLHVQGSGRVRLKNGEI